MVSVQLICLLLATISGVRGDPPAPTGTPSPAGAPSPNGPGSPTSQAPPNDPLITIGGSTVEGSFEGGTILAANSAGAYIIGSQTLERGSQIVVSQTTYSLGPGGRDFVVNGQTSSITQGAGGYIPCFALPIDGFNGGCLGEESGAAQTSTAAAATATTGDQNSNSQPAEGSTMSTGGSSSAAPSGTTAESTPSTPSLASMTSSASTTAASTATAGSASSLGGRRVLAVGLWSVDSAMYGLFAGVSVLFSLAIMALSP